MVPTLILIHMKTMTETGIFDDRKVAREPLQRDLEPAALR